MKAEPSWLIPLKPIENVELFIEIYFESEYWKTDFWIQKLKDLNP